MKVLFDHPQPFLLTHGGFQIQIEQTKAALEEVGVHVEHLRWWDDGQRADLIHYFGRPPVYYIEAAHKKGMKVVLGDLLTEMGSRAKTVRGAQRAAMSLAELLVPTAFRTRLAWDSFRVADACVALTAWEAQLLREMFRAPADRVFVIPNGVEKVFFESAPAKRGPWLVCTATITERKRVAELAEAAVRAQVPVWIVGKPYSDGDPYARRFLEVAKANSSLVRYEGPIDKRSDLARSYREARGFVLLSTMESQSLSALEAAACECPLLLSDLPWARGVFGERASYCPVPASTAETGAHLKRFYNQAPVLPKPQAPFTWMEVAEAFKALYERVVTRRA
jgi:glycosyltransferase involved in cell wall biosynthesis